ncbi:MAG: hypothetical protein WCQ53_01170 [bacterium]
MKKITWIFIFSMLFSVHAAYAVGADYKQLPKPGKKIAIDPNKYFIYGFVQRPKMGSAIMKVEVFSKDGIKDTSLTIKGDVDMPSMRGAHSTGEREFALSAKGTYLLPVELVMPGDWEFRFNFIKNGNSVFRGAYLFDL